MKITINIDSRYTDPELVVNTHQVDERLQSIIDTLSQAQSESIVGIKDEAVFILKPEQLYRIYSAQGKVYADDGDLNYRLRIRLYDAEKQLIPQGWVRISHSELINLNRVKCFDLKLSGTILVEFSNGVRSYVSRRYVSKVKAALGI